MVGMHRSFDMMDKTLRLDEQYSVEEDKKRFRSAYTEVVKRMVSAGMGPPEPPLDENNEPYRPQLVERVSDLPPKDILDFLSNMGRWLDYVGWHAAAYRVQHDGVRRALSNLKANLRTKAHGSVADKSDFVLNNPEYRELDVEEFQTNAYAELSQASYEGGEKTFFVASRAITAHGQDLERVMKESGAQRRPFKRGGGHAPKM